MSERKSSPACPATIVFGYILGTKIVTIAAELRGIPAVVRALTEPPVFCLSGLPNNVVTSAWGPIDSRRMMAAPLPCILVNLVRGFCRQYGMESPMACPVSCVIIIGKYYFCCLSLPSSPGPSVGLDEVAIHFRQSKRALRQRTLLARRRNLPRQYSTSLYFYNSNKLR
jgi:hypothetical protein